MRKRRPVFRVRGQLVVLGCPLQRPDRAETETSLRRDRDRTTYHVGSLPWRRGAGRTTGLVMTASHYAGPDALNTAQT